MSGAMTKATLTCPTCLSELTIEVPNRSKPVALAFYGGFPDGHGEDDTTFLRNLATWLDAIDDAAEKGLADHGIEHTIERTVQSDVRRIADRLGDAIALGDA